MFGFHDSTIVQEKKKNNFHDRRCCDRSQLWYKIHFAKIQLAAPSDEKQEPPLNRVLPTV